MSLSSTALVDRLRPELDQLVEAIENDDSDGGNWRREFDEAAADLCNTYADILDEHTHTPIPFDDALAILEGVIITVEREQGINHWSAVRTLRELAHRHLAQTAAMN